MYKEFIFFFNKIKLFLFNYLQKFLNWMKTEDLLKPDVKFAFVTCGDADLDHL